MERDDQIELYVVVAAGLKQAHARVRALDIGADGRRALVHKLLAITAAAKRDLADAARRLDSLMSDIDRLLEVSHGAIPDPGPKPVSRP